MLPLFTQFFSRKYVDALLARANPTMPAHAAHVELLNTLDETPLTVPSKVQSVILLEVLPLKK
jgi:hypothetical protein